MQLWKIKRNTLKMAFFLTEHTPNGVQVGDTDDIECDYEVQYIDENELLTVKLHEDLENNDLVIL